MPRSTSARPHASDLCPQIIPTSTDPYTRPDWRVLNYYTRATIPPPRPGWYFCQLSGACCHLYWDGKSWPGEVLYWAELPGFVRALLGEP